MKILLPIALLFLLAASTGCRKNRDDGGGGPDENRQPSLADVAAMLNTQEAAVLEWEKSWKAHGDSMRAAFDMGQWLLGQSDVERVYIPNAWNVAIHYKSGLKSSIGFTLRDAAGRARFRDGGSDYQKGSLTTYTLGGHGKAAGAMAKEIGNTKVLLFVPFEEEFYGTYPYLSKFDQSKIKLDVTLATGDAANFSVFKTSHEYGLIFLNTHGYAIERSFAMFTGVNELDIPTRPTPGRWEEAELVEYLKLSGGNELVEALLEGTLLLSTQTGIDAVNSVSPVDTRIQLCVTDRYVSEMPNKLKDAVVFGNHCFSGFSGPVVRYEGDPGLSNTPNFSAAWMNAGAVAYYGYAFGDGWSAVVENSFCVQVEDSLITNLAVREDSTGIAHLASDVAEHFYETSRRSQFVIMPKLTKQEWVEYKSKLTSEFTDKMYLKLYHSPEYSYGCGTFTDPRDGQTYKLACIGDQTWMAENLRYNAPGSRFYNDDPANGPVYGRLYTYDAVSAGMGVAAMTGPGLRGVCPQGWHVPSRWDYDRLRATLTQKYGASGTGTQIKAKSALWVGDPTVAAAMRDTARFAALPAGYHSAGFDELGQATAFWLSSYYDNTSSNPNRRALITLQSNSAELDYDQDTPDPDDALSCRCVKD